MKVKGNNSKVDEVCLVDSFHAFRNDCFHTHVHRTEGCMFTGGSLTVAEAGDDDVVFTCFFYFFRAFIEFRVDDFEEELGVFWDVAIDTSFLLQQG